MKVAGLTQHRLVRRALELLANEGLETFERAQLDVLYRRALKDLARLQQRKRTQAIAVTLSQSQ